jgi:hypothetical protein
MQKVQDDVPGCDAPFILKRYIIMKRYIIPTEEAPDSPDGLPEIAEIPDYRVSLNSFATPQ